MLKIFFVFFFKCKYIFYFCYSMLILLDKGLLCIYFGYFYSDILYNLCDICICNYFGLLYKFCYFGMD